jgi:uncharacterized protein YjbI with pentapeptide repeats
MWANGGPASLKDAPMANDEHIRLLKQGVPGWNAWRKENFGIKPDLGGAHLSEADLIEARLGEVNLSGADLSGARLFNANLTGADLREANLSWAALGRADLSGAKLFGADLRGAFLGMANLSGANLSEAILWQADLSQADLNKAILWRANLHEADLNNANLGEANLSEAILLAANLSRASLNEANLRGALLEGARLLETDFTGADLTSCGIFGISAWRLKLERAKQQNLVITWTDKAAITVDNIEVAQFIYLILHNQKIRDVIDTITSKAVLILGRFTDERKAVLDALREELRNRNLLPILFDFSIPASRDVTETIKTLASLARFVIADVTDATEVRVELHNIVPDFTSLPIQLILLRGRAEFVSLSHLTKFPWVLPIFEYDDREHLLASLDKNIVSPADNAARTRRS